MQRRRFVALGAGVVSTALAGCFGAGTTPGNDGREISLGSDGPREVNNELATVLTVVGESLIEEARELTFTLRLENISEEAVTADVAVTMLDANGSVVSDEYVRRGVTIEAGEEATVSFDIDEDADEVGNYKLDINRAESGTDEGEEESADDDASSEE